MSAFSSLGHLPTTHKKARGHTASRPRGHAIPARTRATDSTAPAGGLLPVVKASLFALPITAAIGLILLLVTAGIAFSTPDPDALTAPLALGILAVTSLLGGLISARREGQHPLLCGLVVGVLFTVLLWSASALVRDASASLGLSPLMAFALHATVVLLAMLGAWLGRVKPTKVRHHSACR